MHFLFYAPQMAPYGGMERHICTLAAAAAENGHSVRFLTTSNSLGAELRALLTHPRINFRELAVARGGAGAAAKALWLAKQTLSARCKGPWDALYTNGQSAFASWVWHAASKNTRIIHHHHTAADAGEQATWSPGFRSVLRRAPLIAGCSKTTCEAIAKAVPGCKPPVFLPYLTRCVMAPEEVQERASSATLKIGFLGRLVKEKGIDRVLELAQREELKDIEWHIHGEGPAYPASCFEGRSRVYYHGPYRSAEQHRKILEGLDAVILLSTHNEGMPLSLIEAMSAGLPWVATDRGGTKELAVDAQASLVLAPERTTEELVPELRAFADRLLSRGCSRKKQRQAYDSFLEPKLVSAQWLALLEGKVLAPSKSG